MKQSHTPEPEITIPTVTFSYPAEEHLPKDIHEELTVLQKTGMAVFYSPIEQDAPYGAQPYELAFGTGEVLDSFDTKDILVALRRVKAERVN